MPEALELAIPYRSFMVNKRMTTTFFGKGM